ncbi:sensor histidine kinase [Roseateles paludis]|uniref:histidine kinase n=1 Tax=Roseateles paludis TaxID=3145238 RepID=A0ABV0G145_9BURK
MPPPRNRSLRSQLLAPLRWIWLLGLTAAAAGAYWLATASANIAFDRGLQDEASALAAKIVWTDRGPLLDVSRQALELLTWDNAVRNAFVVVDESGRAIAGDAHVPLPDRRDTSFASPQVFDAEFEGEAVRGAIFSLSSPMLDRSVSIVVVETRHRRQRLLRDVALAMAMPTLAIALLTTGLLAWGIRRGLAPLRETASEVARRAPSDLRALPVEGVPAEVVPLIERINSLLADVQQSVSLQQRFVADAAHQLRTPVAGLRVLIQELAQELPLDANLAPLVQALSSSGERLSRLIGQLLSLVRTQGALGVETEVEALDVAVLLRQAAEPAAVRAARAGRELELQAPAPGLRVRAHAFWLGEALSNVLDNALRYGGPHIVLRASSTPEGHVRIEIEDNGAGVPPEDLPRLIEPFWRGQRADVREAGGSGLGLAIAYEIITRLGGHWVLRSRPEVDGFRVEWLLPAAEA